MTFSLILILVGSGCLLLRESTATIYGTYNVFDHLGPHPASEASSTANTDTRQIKNTTIITKKSSAYYSPSIQTKQVSPQSPHIQTQTQHLQIHPAQQQHSVQQPATEIPQPVAPSPLQTPQYEDAIARPFDTSMTVQPQMQQDQQQLTSTASSTPAMTRVPLYLYNPGLARRLGISTFMMGSVLYGLSLLPALLAVGATSGVGPFAGQIIIMNIPFLFFDKKRRNLL
jgi:hypothetical protein